MTSCAGIAFGRRLLLKADGVAFSCPEVRVPRHTPPLINGLRPPLASSFLVFLHSFSFIRSTEQNSGRPKVSPDRHFMTERRRTLTFHFTELVSTDDRNALMIWSVYLRWSYTKDLDHSEMTIPYLIFCVRLNLFDASFNIRWTCCVH
jgi:hypothetical protein